MSGWTVQLDPPSVAEKRVALDLNSGPIRIGGTSGGVGIDWGTAQITAYMTQQGVYGNSPASFVVPNRTITIPLMLGADDSGTEETARSQLQQKVALIQREGGWLLRQRDGGPAMYADIVDAQVVIPDTFGETGGVEPNVSLVLTCLPDFYGDEVTLDTIAATGICDRVLNFDGMPAVIDGDYPARCRVIVEEGSDQTQQGVVWAFRARHFDPALTARLYFAASSLLFGPGLATVAGSQNVQVQQLSATTTPADLLQLVDSSGNLTHVGTYRVLVRAYSTAADVALFLAWTAAVQGTDIVNAAATIPAANQWFVLDLGTVTLAAPPVGKQQWNGGVKAQTPSGTATVSADYMLLVPLDESAGQATGNPTVHANYWTEIRSEGTYWGDGAWSGANYQPVASQTGDLPRLPPSGLEAREVEMLVKPSRGDFATLADTGVDALAVQVIYRPCWLSRP